MIQTSRPPRTVRPNLSSLIGRRPSLISSATLRSSMSPQQRRISPQAFGCTPNSKASTLAARSRIALPRGWSDRGWRPVR